MLNIPECSAMDALLMLSKGGFYFLDANGHGYVVINAKEETLEIWNIRNNTIDHQGSGYKLSGTELLFQDQEAT